MQTARVFGHYEVVDAASGEEAIEKVKTERPEIVLLDLGMPGGLPACRSIRATSSARIIIVSASDADKAGALGAGVDGYISKPFSIAEVISRIKAFTSED